MRVAGRLLRRLFSAAEGGAGKHSHVDKAHSHGEGHAHHGEHGAGHGHHDHRLPSRSSSELMSNNISTVLEGTQNVNYIEEFQDLTPEERAGKKRFLIYRFNPEDPNSKPKYSSYYIDLSKIAPMYLDALLYIKDNLDSTLSLRRSCREGICGSCAMNCDGLHSLACIREINRDLTRPAIITPLGHMYVLKDLVVDMTHFYTQYKSIEPYLKRKTPKAPGQKEYVQSIEDRKKLDGLYECVLCASCSTSCPSYWWHPEEYLVPAVLMQAYRWVIDSRDEYTQERLEKLEQGHKISSCENIGMCSVTCPKGLDPRTAIQSLAAMVKANREQEGQQEL